MSDVDGLGQFASDADARAARTALARARPDTTVATVAPLGRGNRKRTVLATLQDGDRVVLQFTDDECLLESETALLTAVGERTSVPVPPVLASGVEDGVAYLCTAHVAGADLHERFAGFETREQCDLARSFGRHLADLHATFTFDGYGEVTVREGALRVGDAVEAWADWLGAYGRGALERLPAEFDDIRPRLRALVADPDVDHGAPARLYPWDFRPGNALVADGTVAAVLDWESPLAAAPALSVAKAEHLVTDWYVDDPAPLRRAFRDGYASVRPVPSVEPVHRVAAVADSAVDSRGVVTNPRYPELDREASTAFHRHALESII